MGLVKCNGGSVLDKIKKFIKSPAFMRLIMIMCALGILLYASTVLKKSEEKRETYKEQLEEIKEQDVFATNGSSKETAEKTSSKKKSEDESFSNIEKASDYVNFEKLIMQVSEFTEPDENDLLMSVETEDAETESTDETAENAATNE